MKIATLILEDGTMLQGEAFGANTDAVFELVFNTSMTGYQEIITDPSYRGQGVLFTVSHIAVCFQLAIRNYAPRLVEPVRYSRHQRCGYKIFNPKT